MTTRHSLDYLLAHSIREPPAMFNMVHSSPAFCRSSRARSASWVSSYSLSVGAFSSGAQQMGAGQGRISYAHKESDHGSYGAKAGASRAGNSRWQAANADPQRSSGQGRSSMRGNHDHDSDRVAHNDTRHDSRSLPLQESSYGYQRGNVRDVGREATPSATSTAPATQGLEDSTVYKGPGRANARRANSSSSWNGDRMSLTSDNNSVRGRMPHGEVGEDWQHDHEEEQRNDYSGPEVAPRSQRGGRRERDHQTPWYSIENRGNGQPYYEAPSTTIRDNLKGEVLYGCYPVLAALRAKRRVLHTLYVQSSMDVSKRKDGAAVTEVFRIVKQMDIPTEYIGRHELNLLSGDRPHQGLVLDAGGLEWAKLDEFPPAHKAAQEAAAAGNPQPVWLALDEVVDPQNLGAVLRSAYCLGAAGVLGCGRNCAPLSAVVSKASAGSLEMMTLFSCHNLPRTLQDAASKGWAVLGAAADSNAVGVSKVCAGQPTILVVGSEGSGLRTNVRRACHKLVKVEMGLPPRSDRVVDSLNVSVATGILLHALVEAARAAGKTQPVHQPTPLEVQLPELQIAVE